MQGSSTFPGRVRWWGSPWRAAVLPRGKDRVSSAAAGSPALPGVRQQAQHDVPRDLVAGPGVHSDSAAGGEGERF